MLSSVGQMLKLPLLDFAYLQQYLQQRAWFNVALSKDPDATKVWLDSLPDDGRDVFLNLPMSCRGVFFKVPEFEGNSQKFKEKMTALLSEKAESKTESAEKPRYCGVSTRINFESPSI